VEVPSGPNNMKTKICTRCKTLKNLNEFHRDSRNKSGITSWCDRCHKEYQKQYDEKYTKLHRKEILKKKQLYSSSHKTEKAIYDREYYQEHKEERIENVKQWNKLHTEERREYKKKYSEINRDKINVYRKNKSKTDINFRITDNLRSRLRQALRNNSKSDNTFILLGCSIEFLKDYLERKFITGMTWENYGTWHIDHIIPCASFNMSKVLEQYKCFNYKNLQPLWAIDNLIKHDKILQ